MPNNTTTDIHIKNVPTDFAEMINDIYNVYQNDIRCGIEINFSGTKIHEDHKMPFGWKINNIVPREGFRIVKEKKIGDV